MEGAGKARGWHCLLLCPGGLAPGVIFSLTAMSGNTHEGYEWVHPACEKPGATYGEAMLREQGAARGWSWQRDVLLPQMSPPRLWGVKVVFAQGAGGCSHPQASPLPTQHLVGAELL